MSNNTAKLKVSIDNMSSLSKPVQSFANFIMSDCSLSSIRKIGYSSLSFSDIPENKQQSAEFILFDDDDYFFHLDEPYFNYSGKFKINKFIIPLEDTDIIEDGKIEIDIPDDGNNGNFTVINGLLVSSDGGFNIYNGEADRLEDAVMNHEDEIIAALSELGIDPGEAINQAKLGVILTHKLNERIASNIQLNSYQPYLYIAAKYGEVNHNEWDPGELAKFIAPDDFEITNVKEIRVYNEGSFFSGTVKFILDGDDATIKINNQFMSCTATINNYLSFSASDIDSITAYDNYGTEYDLSDLINIIPKSGSDYDPIGLPDHTSDSSPYEIEIPLTHVKTENDLLVYHLAARGILNCDTVYTKYKSEFNLYTRGEDFIETPGYERIMFGHVNYIDMPKIPITISTIVDGKENKDKNLVPMFVDDETTNSIDESIYNSIKINSNSHKNINWKLRTSSFYLLPQNGSNEIARNVYYKIGFCPLDGKEASENEIINYLKLHCLQLYAYSSAISKINLINTLEVDKHLSIEELEIYNDQYPSSPWSMLLDSDGNNLGIIYMKLYDSLTGEVLDKSQYNIGGVQPSESYSEKYICLRIFDFKINKGYMPSSSSYYPFET